MNDQSRLVTSLMWISEPYNTVEEARSELDLGPDAERPGFIYGYVNVYNRTLVLFYGDPDPQLPPPPGFRRITARCRP